MGPTSTCTNLHVRSSQSQNCGGKKTTTTYIVNTEPSTKSLAQWPAPQPAMTQWPDHLRAE